MRNMKRLTSLLLALAMVFSLAVTAFADEAGDEITESTYSITINNSASGHIYEAYQIFTGKLSGNAENDDAAGTAAVLSDILWGTGVSEEGQAALLAKYEAENAAALAEKLNAVNIKEFVTEVSKYLTTPAAGDETVEDGKYVIEGLTAGYYLIKDQNGSLNGDNDSYTSYIMEVIEDSTVSPKSSVPEVQKKVKDINDSTESAMTDWQDSADHDIGDTVPFQLKAILASNVADYLKYKVVFHDTMSRGLTFVKITSVTIVNQDGDVITLTEGQYAVATAALTDNAQTENFVEGTALTITIEDVKGLGAENDAEVIVEYEATLNTEAILGAPGNPNVVYLEYSNNPNWGWDIWNDTDGDEKWDEGETPDEEEDETDDENTGKTPEDKVIVFTYKTVINKVDANNEALAGAEFKLEKYNTNDKTWEEIAVVKNEAGTVFTFSGLDDGLYCLTETLAPEGYNAIDPIYFEVTAEHQVLAEDPQLTALNATETNADGSDLAEGTVGSFTVTHDLKAGSLSADVVNKAGVVLPETGGMGTTLFYMVGAFLVLSATVLLVTKRRMAM